MKVGKKTVRLDIEQHKRIKAHSGRTEKSIELLVFEAISDYIDKHKILM